MGFYLLPWEPWLPPRGAAQFFKKISFIIILFHFGDIYTLQSILAVWSQMFICSAIMCYVHATKGIDTPLTFLETAHLSVLTRDYFSRKQKELYQQKGTFYKQASIPSNQQCCPKK